MSLSGLPPTLHKNALTFFIVTVSFLTFKHNEMALHLVLAADETLYLFSVLKEKPID